MKSCVQNSLVNQYHIQLIQHVSGPSKLKNSGYDAKIQYTKDDTNVALLNKDKINICKKL